MRGPFVISIPLNFLINEENFILFFISADAILFFVADWACLDEVVGDGGVVLVDGRGPGQVHTARGEGHDERLTRNTRYI